MSSDNATKSQAQQRRQMENEEFSKLAKELPLARAISGQHIDKTTMVRLATSYIKLHNLLDPANSSLAYGSDSNWSSNYLELFDGFFLILDQRGDVLYISETISIYLGLSLVEMTGNQFTDYVHEEDVHCLQSALNFCDINWPQMCNIRVKSSLTKRASKDSVRACPGFKVLRLEISMASNYRSRLIACLPMPTPILSTVLIPNQSFVIITGIDLKIIHADDRAHHFLSHYQSDPLKGASFYSFIHISDTEIIRKTHFDVLTLGAYKTPYYRMININNRSVFYVESCIFRHTNISAKQFTDSITFVTSVL